eukprot:8134953-Pyramimonas_sp.AAC.1
MGPQVHETTECRTQGPKFPAPLVQPFESLWPPTTGAPREREKSWHEIAQAGLGSLLGIADVLHLAEELLELD